MNEKEKEEKEIKSRVKKQLKELCDLLSSSDVDCMIAVVKIGDDNYSCMFGESIEAVKLILDAREQDDIFNSLMNIQEEIRSKVRTERNRFNTSIN